MNIILSGGGTAGHIYPAIAIAELCLKNIPNSRVLFVGRRGGGENAPIIKGGYSLEELEVSGIPRSLSPKAITSAVKALGAVRRARDIIKDFSADLIIGTGGYVCWPVLRAGQRLGVPTLLHESNAVPGLSTRLLSGRCEAVMLGFERAGDRLSRRARVCVVGNPVRSSFATLGRNRARMMLGIPENRFLVVSFGGSLGAKVLNEAVIGCMARYKEFGIPIMHIHSCGKRYYDEALQYAVERGTTDKDIAHSPYQHNEVAKYSIGCRSDNCRLVPYIEDMPLWLSAADLAITRSGAITLAELSAAAVPAILIPSPNVSGNHQYENALCYSSKGAAVLIEEKGLSQDRLYENIITLYRDKERRRAMSGATIEFSSTTTDEKILNIILSTLER